MRRSRRDLLAGVGAAGAAALAGCGVLANKGFEEPSGSVAAASPPADAGDRTYATMGDADAPTVTYVGNWKCPYCAQFDGDFLHDIVTEYVEPGDVSVRFRSLAYRPNGKPFLGPDAVRASRFGLAVWHVDPANYWRFHDFVFRNQPSEKKEWATTDRLVDFADRAGVSDTDTVRQRVESGRYLDPVKQTARWAFDRNVSGTPAFVIEGSTYNPLGQEGAVRNHLDSL